MTSEYRRIDYRTCTCGKRGYASRTDAKRIIRGMVGGTRGVPGSRLTHYRCSTDPDLYHIGHSTIGLLEFVRTQETV